MQAKQENDLSRRSVLGAFWLALLGALLYGFLVFKFDYYRMLKQGENGKMAIQMLDQMRRPFLSMKQAELHLLQSTHEASDFSQIESAINDGRQTLSQYLELVSYNEEARQKVILLNASYEAWVSLELELAHSLAGSKRLQKEHNELDMLMNKNAAAFLTVMNVLGEGENPIHHDIEAGSAATRGLLVSSLTFIAYLIGVVFWREWVRHRRELQYYENELQLNRLALTDGLTGLGNRILLDNRLSIAIAEARRSGCRVGIIFLDLDGFKAINDELGHEAGDSVLKEVALRLQKHTREMDTVARVGGDEFIVLMTNFQDTAEAHLVADKLKVVLDQPFELHGKPYLVRASLGIAIFPDDGNLSEQLLKHADVAMYEAKRKAKLNHASLRPEPGS